MAALTFPAAPLVGDVYPADPGTSGVTQYQWDGTKWNAVLSTVSLGTANQGAYNQYDWPATDGSTGHQLTTDGSGTLSWSVPSSPSMQVLGLLEPFDGANVSFTIVQAGTSIAFSPAPFNQPGGFLGWCPADSYRCLQRSWKYHHLHRAPWPRHYLLCYL